MGLYLRPIELGEAVAALAERPMTVLAGGTDLYPACVGRPLSGDTLDIGGIANLRGITQLDDHFRLGATTTWSDLLAEPLPPWFDALKLAAREVGGVQIQNAGTVAGNLCNASPAADGIPALLALDASIELAASGDRRILPLPEFVLGNRRTARRPHEILTAVLVPKPRHEARAGFAKLGGRKYLVISIVMVAAMLEIDAERVATARVAIGACSPLARRLPALEQRLIGEVVGAGLGSRVLPEHLEVLSPIDDARGTAAYRLDAAKTMVGRVLDHLATRRDRE